MKQGVGQDGRGGREGYDCDGLPERPVYLVSRVPVGCHSL